MFSVIFGYIMRSARDFFSHERFARTFTVTGFIAVFAFLVLLVYALFYFGFRYIARDDYFGDALTLYVVELFFLVTFLLVFGSALLSGLFAFFRAKDEEFIIASPSYAAKLSLALLRIMFSSLWPLLVIVIPALVALHKVEGLPLFGIGLALLSSVFLFMLASTLAAVVILFVGAVLARLNRFSWMSLVTFVGALFAVLLLFVWRGFASVDLITYFQAETLERTAADIAPVVSQYQYFPSHLSALTVYFASHDDLPYAVQTTLYGLFSLLAVLIVLYLLRSHFLYLWQLSREGSGEKAKAHFGRSALVRSRSPLGAIFGKEIITFVRNGRGIFWLGFILLIWAIQAATNHVFVKGLAANKVSENALPSVVGMFQFATSIYFVAMFSLRFAFPSWSAERKTGWSIGSSPLDLRQVFRAKMLFFGGLFVILGAIFTMMNVAVAGAPLSFGIFLLSLVVVGTVTLTALGLSLGALFPNRDTDDPERLSTTLPGLSFIFIALLYGAIGAYVFRVCLTGEYLFFALFIALSLLSAWVFLQKGEAAVMRREWF